MYKAAVDGLAAQRGAPDPVAIGLAACAPEMQLPLLLPLAGTAALAACNGRPELCGRRYSDVTFVGTHNSVFVGETLAHNQLVSVTEQLDSGVRFLQAQTHDKSGEIEMCHTNCWELDVGPLTEYLQEVADWMGGHADEVVTLLLTNIDGIAVDKFDAAFGSSGLRGYAFRPRGVAAKDQWPTLQELIAAGTRLVVFMGESQPDAGDVPHKGASTEAAADYHADQAKVDYILSEFDYYWETPYGITDKSFPTCSVDRPSGGDPSRLMGIMNHMLNYRIGDVVFPDMLDAGNTNSLASIQKQVDLCKSQGKGRPNVVLVS